MKNDRLLKKSISVLLIAIVIVTLGFGYAELSDNTFADDSEQMAGDTEQAMEQVEAVQDAAVAESSAGRNIIDCTVTGYIKARNKFGQAQSNELKTASGGKPGDQSGREVCICKFSYGKKSTRWNHWTFVARFKDPAKANKAATAMEKACKNKHVGFDIPKRGDLYEQLQAVNFDMSKITKNTSTSCTPLVIACAACGGVGVEDGYWEETFTYGGKTYPRYMLESHNGIKAQLKGTGEFIILTGKKYTTKSKYLKRGDILCSEGHHCAMML